MVRLAAISFIVGYQRWLSPRKGFACPHRLLHAGPSCSEYAKGVCLERGLLAALRSMRGRFGECRRAAQLLRERRVLMAAGDHRPGEGFEFAGHSAPGAEGEKQKGDTRAEKDPKKKGNACDGSDGLCNILACGIEILACV